MHANMHVGAVARLGLHAGTKKGHGCIQFCRNLVALRLNNIHINVATSIGVSCRCVMKLCHLHERSAERGNQIELLLDQLCMQSLLLCGALLGLLLVFPLCLLQLLQRCLAACCARRGRRPRRRRCRMPLLPGLFLRPFFATLLAGQKAFASFLYLLQARGFVEVNKLNNGGCHHWRCRPPWRHMGCAITLTLTGRPVRPSLLVSEVAETVQACGKADSSPGG